MTDSDLLDLCQRYEKVQKKQQSLKEEMKLLKLDIGGTVRHRHNAKHVGPFKVKMKRTMVSRPLGSIKALMENLDRSRQDLEEMGLIKISERKTLEITRQEPDAVIIGSVGDRVGSRRMIVE